MHSNKKAYACKNKPLGPLLPLFHSLCSAVTPNCCADIAVGTDAWPAFVYDGSIFVAQPQVMALGEQHGIEQATVDEQLRALRNNKIRPASTEELRYFKLHPGMHRGGCGKGWWRGYSDSFVGTIVFVNCWHTPLHVLTCHLSQM